MPKATPEVNPNRLTLIKRSMDRIGVFRISGFGFDSSFGLRHSDFVESIALGFGCSLRDRAVPLCLSSIVGFGRVFGLEIRHQPMYS
jgi:hypothetical protein